MLSSLAACPLTISSTCSSNLFNRTVNNLNKRSERTRKSFVMDSSNFDEQFLSSIEKILRPKDQIKRIVTLNSSSSDFQRYFVILKCFVEEIFEQFLILGLDVNKDQIKIGLVLPIENDLSLSINGDGFKLTSSGRSRFFRPVNVRALWNICQDLHKISSQTCRTRSTTGDKNKEISLEFYSHPDRRSNSTFLNEWNQMDENFVTRRFNCKSILKSDEKLFYHLISKNIKEILLKVDLNEITSKSVFDQLENSLQMSLISQKSLIDELILEIFGQMDRSTMILPHLFLGSEWNASNFDELKTNRIGFILNVSREIENFFPEHFQYLNIRVDDEIDSNLLKEWDQTNRFINEAKKSQRACLVHCKMGISRSASTVLAYLMKETNRSLSDAFEYVKQRRSCVNPNEGFRNQLTIYEGILFANRKFRN